MKVQDFIAFCQNSQLIHKTEVERGSSPITDGIWLLHESTYGESHLAFMAMSFHTMIWNNIQAHDIDNIDGNLKVGLDFKAFFEFCEKDKAEPDDTCLLPALIHYTDIQDLLAKLKSFNKNDTVFLKSVEGNSKDGIILNFVVGLNYSPLTILARSISSLIVLNRDDVMNLYERLALEERDFPSTFRIADVNGGQFITTIKRMNMITKIIQNMKVEKINVTLYNKMGIEKSEDGTSRKYVIHHHMRYTPTLYSNYGVIEMCDRFYNYKKYLD